MELKGADKPRPGVKNGTSGSARPDGAGLWPRIYPLHTRAKVVCLDSTKNRYQHRSIVRFKRQESKALELVQVHAICFFKRIKLKYEAYNS